MSKRCDYNYYSETRKEDLSCGFDIDEGDYHELDDGTSWCDFHVPLTVNANGEEVKTIKHDWCGEKIMWFNDSIIDKISSMESDSEYIELSGVVYPKNIHFTKLITSAVDFSNSTFNGSCCFNNMRFVRPIFGQFALFDDVQFKDNSSFEDTRFEMPVSFRRSFFEGNAYFIDAILEEESFFDKSTFKLASYFKNVTFHRRANFRCSIFRGYTDFSFEENILENTGDSKYINRDNFTSEINFKDARFESIVKFNGRNFLNTTNFENTYFGGLPKFHSCRLHADTTFKGAIFDDKKSAEAPITYCTLKNEMGKFGRRDNESTFYALEQESIRNQANTVWWVKIASLLYERISNYGQNFLLPLIYLALSVFLFFIFYNAIEYGNDFQGKYFYFSVLQVIKPFNALLQVGTNSNPILINSTVIVPLFAAMQSIISIMLITLFLLALRLRFKRG